MLWEILADWRWILRYSAHYKWAVFFYTVCGVASTSMGLVSSVAGKYLIDRITGFQGEQIGLLLLLLVGSSIFSIFLGNIISRITAKVTISITNDIQADLFERIADAQWMELNRYSNGDMLNRFTSDVGMVSGNAISWIPMVMIAIYQFVATFLVILHYDRGMALIAVASAPFLLLISRTMLQKQRTYGTKVRETNSELMTFATEAFYNLDSIKSFGIVPCYGKKLRGWQQQVRAVSLGYNLFTIRTNIALSGVGLAVQLLAFGYCLFLLWMQDITYGTMALFLQQRNNLSGAFQNMLSLIPSFLNSSIAAHRLRELMELPGEIHLSGKTELAGMTVDGFEVRMHGVEFAYADGREVFSEASFQAAPGEIIAFVGASGEGKTTLIRLLLGLIHPQQGDVVLVASNGTHMDLNAETRKFFSYVPQGNTMLAGTIAENLRMVKEDATEVEIVKALKTACAWEFVAKQPDGIDMKLGERGKGLSEGQAQRIAIARALLRDAPVLLLDEATSALDVDTERNVLQNIVDCYPNRTCIVTTHRQAVLQRCTRIYQIQDARICEVDRDGLA